VILIAQRMLDAAFAADATGTAVLKRVGPVETVHTFAWSAGVSVGEAVVEAVPSADYEGDGHVLETVTFSGTAPKTDTVRMPGSYPVIRHRITTPINDGGSVTSRIDGSA
jgi:hypothetical protein